MAEKFDKIKCKTISLEIKFKINTVFNFQVSKTQYSGQNTMHHTAQ